MKINKRLKKISEFINNNSFILDVGCDHALLDIYLVLTKKNIKCLATDIRKKPLEKAQLNIDKYQIKDKITLAEADGLEKLTKDIDTIVISGMGALTIIDILRKNLTKITNQKLIISPNNEEELIREYLLKKEFKIIKEVLVEDKNIIYPIIIFEKGKQNLTKKELLYGPYLLKNKDDLFFKYYSFKLQTLIKIKNHLPIKYLFKKIFLNKKIREIKSIL